MLSDQDQTEKLDPDNRSHVCDRRRVWYSMTQCTLIPLSIPFSRHRQPIEPIQLSKLQSAAALHVQVSRVYIDLLVLPI